MIDIGDYRADEPIGIKMMIFDGHGADDEMGEDHISSITRFSFYKKPLFAVKCTKQRVINASLGVTFL